MKTIQAQLTFAAFAASIWAASATTFDDFNGIAIDPSLWEVSLPFGTSQVSESLGSAIFQGRGGLNTIESFSDSVSIQGRFRFASTLDHFRIVFRSDLSFNSSYQEKSGMIIVFDQGGAVQIGESEKSSLAISGYDSDNWVDFLLRDNGKTVNLYVNDLTTPLLTAESTYRTGDKVGFYNREFSSTRVEVDYLSIQSVADSGSTLGMVCVGFLAMVSFRSLQRPERLHQ